MALYDTVVQISKPYLGPAAVKFIERQCKTHLKIDPQALEKTHLSDLAKWMDIGAGLIMEPLKAKELGEKVKAL